MGHKRKRSNVEISPASTSSFLSSPSSRTSTSPSPNPYQFFGNTMQIEAPISNFGSTLWNSTRGESLGARLHSRTQKRLRNRDDEEKIGQSTIHKLFDAQRQHPNASPVLSHDEPPPSRPTIQKSTLHSFWRLPQAPAQVIQPSIFENQDTARCEDCERALPVGNAGDVDMMGTDFGNECACQNCGRRVCDVCAVNLGGRVCLNCVAVVRR